MKKNYVGMANTFHDSAVAIVNSEGEVVFAEATERYLQNKRAIHGVPDQMNRIGKVVREYCDPDASLVVAHSWSEDAERMIQGTRLLAAKEEDAWKDSAGNVPNVIRTKLSFRKLALAAQSASFILSNKTLQYELDQMGEWTAGREVSVKCFDHHTTHAAAACFTSPYAEGACAVVDGYGEGSACQSFVYEKGKLSNLKKVAAKEFLGASLGIMYMTVCDVCGFGYFSGEEWKVMGLAAYGTWDQRVAEILRAMFHVNGLNIESCNSLKYNQNLRKLYEYKKKPRESALKMANGAYTAQMVFSELLYEFLSNLHDEVKSDNVMLGGGCMLNSWANGEITEKTGFKNAYVFSAPADDGNAIGAALLAYYEDHPGRRPLNRFQSPYLGSSMSTDIVDKLTKFSGLPIRSHGDQVCERTAKLLAAGGIVGWVQGRAEFGPRALGNRSILADPRSQNCKDIINARVKFREEFRPFAPAILHEFGPDYFENYQETPYMERTLRFRKDVISKVPGVVHDNMTGRLQSVKREWNERFYALLQEFNRLTGVPVLLNTSFNVMGKPIIHSVEDAIAVFFTSGLDALVIGDLMIEKAHVRQDN